MPLAKLNSILISHNAIQCILLTQLILLLDCRCWQFRFIRRINIKDRVHMDQLLFGLRQKILQFFLIQCLKIWRPVDACGLLIILSLECRSLMKSMNQALVNILVWTFKILEFGVGILLQWCPDTLSHWIESFLLQSLRQSQRSILILILICIKLAAMSVISSLTLRIHDIFFMWRSFHRLFPIYLSRVRPWIARCRTWTLQAFRHVSLADLIGVIQRRLTKLEVTDRDLRHITIT